MYHIFIWSSIEEHLGYFHVLATMNNASLLIFSSSSFIPWCIEILCLVTNTVNIWCLWGTAFGACSFRSWFHAAMFLPRPHDIFLLWASHLSWHFISEDSQRPKLKMNLCRGDFHLLFLVKSPGCTNHFGSFYIEVLCN